MKATTMEAKLDIGKKYMEYYLIFGSAQESCEYIGYSKDYCTKLVSSLKKEYNKRYPRLYNLYKEKAKENQSIGSIEGWSKRKSDNTKSFSKKRFLKELKERGVKEIKRNDVIDILAKDNTCIYSGLDIRLYLEKNGIKVIERYDY